MQVYIYQTNFLVDLGCLIMYEVSILSEPKQTHLMLLSYLQRPKALDGIKMVAIPTWVYPLFKF